jgi:dienelactone hydrolase
MQLRRGRATGILAAIVLVLGAGVSQAVTVGGGIGAQLSCDTPAGNPNPSTQRAAWEERDANDMQCATQRQQDQARNPAYLRLAEEEQATAPDPVSELNDPRPRGVTAVVPAGGDPFRVPSRWEALGRGQYTDFSFISSTGAKLNAALFSPNPTPGARYPIVTFTPGLQEAKEQAWWFSEGLAEAGYVVLAIDPQGQGRSEITARNPDGSLNCKPTCADYPTNDKPETQAAIDFALSTASAPYKYAVGKNAEGTLHYNPLWREVDQSELGIAGHSLGATAVTPIGQSDPRVKTVISYDNLDGSIPTDIVPEIHAPALYFATDYAFPTFSIPMNPNNPPAPEKHWVAYNQMRKAHVDSMVIVPRASTHYEWGPTRVDAAGKPVRRDRLVLLHACVVRPLPQVRAIGADSPHPAHLRQVRGRALDRFGNLQRQSGGCRSHEPVRRQCPIHDRGAVRGQPAVVLLRLDVFAERRLGAVDEHAQPGLFLTPPRGDYVTNVAARWWNRQVPPLLCSVSW